MLYSYFKIGYRNLLKKKLYSLINLLGLAMSITFSLLILSFINGELKVNSNLKDFERIYIIKSEWANEDRGWPFMTISPLAKRAKETYPALIKNYYRFWDRSITVSKNNKIFREQSMIGDSTLVSMLGLPVLYGNPHSAFTVPDAIVITKNIALKYFDNENVVNETLTLQTETAGTRSYVIKAVLDNIPRNSVTDILDIHAQIFLPLANSSYFGLGDPEAWNGNAMLSYLKLNKLAAEDEVETGLNRLITLHAPEEMKEKLHVKLVRIKDYYLSENNASVRKLITTLSIIAFFILLMAIINFINITLGSAPGRLKEIGVRKVMGGLKRELILQFLFESLILALIASLLSILLYETLRPLAADIMGRQVASFFQMEWEFYFFVFVLILLISLAASIYPALVMAAYKETSALKGKLKSVKEGMFFRRGFVTLQFSTAIAVFVSSIVISNQVDYFFRKDLGYDKTAVLTVSSVPRLWSEEGTNKMLAAKEEFLKLPEVSEASLSWSIPNGNYGGNNDFYEFGKSKIDYKSLPTLLTDEHFANTYKIKLSEGSFFQGKNGKWQRERVVVNQAALKAFGWREGTGKKLQIKGDSTIYYVAGVIRNFNFFSFREPVKPLVIIHVKNANIFRYFSFRISTEDMSTAISRIEDKWKQQFPDAPFEYRFMDERLGELYKTELQLKKACETARYITFLIVLSGLLGIVSMSITRRTKEVGIRKVLGASVIQIVLLFAKEFVVLLILAHLVAIPFTYWMMNDWLSNFVYRIHFEFGSFIVVGGLMLLLVILIIILQTIKTAFANPVKSLRAD